MTHYGIVGGGNHAENVIEDGLKDIYFNDADNTLYLYCRTGASESEKRVYGWVLDNHIPFIAVVGEKAPSVLLEAADYITHSEDCAQTIIKELAANSGVLLVLWDDAHGEYLSHLVAMADDLGVECKELSNGLTPFYVSDSLEKAIPASEALQELPVVVQDVEVDPFEGDDDEPEVASDIPTSGAISNTDPLDTVSGGQLTWVDDGKLYTVMLGPEFTKRFLADLRYEPGATI